ncbi:MAG: hypothetical protein ABIH34_03885 [Nanoarchaeota archaeon]
MASNNRFLHDEQFHEFMDAMSRYRPDWEAVLDKNPRLERKLMDGRSPEGLLTPASRALLIDALFQTSQETPIIDVHPPLGLVHNPPFTFSEGSDRILINDHTEDLYGSVSHVALYDGYPIVFNIILGRNVKDSQKKRLRWEAKIAQGYSLPGLGKKRHNFEMHPLTVAYITQPFQHEFPARDVTYVIVLSPDRIDAESYPQKNFLSIGYILPFYTTKTEFLNDIQSQMDLRLRKR